MLSMLLNAPEIGVPKGDETRRTPFACHSCFQISSLCQAVLWIFNHLYEQSTQQLLQSNQPSLHLWRLTKLKMDPKLSFGLESVYFEGAKFKTKLPLASTMAHSCCLGTTRILYLLLFFLEILMGDMQKTRWAYCIQIVDPDHKWAKYSPTFKPQPRQYIYVCEDAGIVFICTSIYVHRWPNWRSQILLVPNPHEIRITITWCQTWMTCGSRVRSHRSNLLLIWHIWHGNHQNPRYTKSSASEKGH